MAKKKSISEPTNGAEFIIKQNETYFVDMEITGSSDLLLHRWNCEAVIAQSKAAKGSKGRKTDNPENYIWRDEKGNICLPSEYVRMAIVGAAKFKQDPRSTRKSAADLFKACIVSAEKLSSLGSKDWDYLDQRKVSIQRNGINRTRPAFSAGWKAKFTFEVLLPEYVDKELFYDVASSAGRLIGVGDFRPTFGRFNITSFKVRPSH